MLQHFMVSHHGEIDRGALRRTGFTGSHCSPLPG
jgi:hypothetical protein